MKSSLFPVFAINHTGTTDSTSEPTNRRPVVPFARPHKTFFRRGLFCSLALLTLPHSLHAQAENSTEESEETLSLSPFVVEDRGYAASRVSGPSQPRFGNDAGGNVPTVPITLIRRADAVIIEFALANSSDKQDLRNKELTDSVDALASAIRTMPGLRFENREVQLATGNRSRSIIGKGGVVTSFANFAVFAELSPEMRLYERVKQVRGLVSGAKLTGATKVIDGPASLFIKRPNETRKDILAKIFEDYEQVKKGFGADFEIMISGLSGPVRLRSCSENEVELWLDYSFTIRSIRELEAKKTDKK